MSVHDSGKCRENSDQYHVGESCEQNGQENKDVYKNDEHEDKGQEDDQLEENEQVEENEHGKPDFAEESGTGSHCHKNRDNEVYKRI
jgi:hypothetical protein